MMLLTNPGYVKTHTGLNDNTYDKMIVPALERAQDIDLTETLGECLVASLQEKVSDRSIEAPGQAIYKALLDNYVQPFLAYTTISNIVLEIGQVMGNGGVDTLTDEHRQSLTMDERGQLKDYWKHHADSYRRKMQNFLKNNRSAFPELSQSCAPCGQGANLESAATTGVWLGGARGKIYNKRICDK